MATKNVKTERDFYNEIKEILNERVDIVEFCDKKIGQLDKKRDGSSEKAKERNAQREIDKNEVLNVLVEIGDWATLKDINSANEKVQMFSNQKLTSLLTEMLKEDKSVERKVDKRVVFYKVA